MQDPSGFIDRCPPDFDGCLCDNGWAGLSCTCPAPADWAYGIPLGGGLNFSYVDMGRRQPVGFVYVTAPSAFVNQGCTALTVSVVDSLGNQPVYCAAEGKRWACPAPYPAGGGYAAYDGYGRFVVVQTLEVYPTCAIEVYENDDPPCGLNGNPYAGRFWAVERYRSPQLYLEFVCAANSANAPR